MKRTGQPLYLGVIAAALLLVAALLASQLLVQPPPPPPQKVNLGAGQGPAVAAEGVGTAPLLYQEELRTDGQRFGVGEVSVDALATPLVRTVEISEPQTLKVGQTLTTPHLQIKLRTENRAAQGERGGFRADHLILSIENLADVPVAYRVDTRVEHPERCRSRGILVHNAIALPAHGKIDRSECLFRNDVVLTLERAETISLPPIGYFYVSQLVPSQIGLDTRTSEGHSPPRLVQQCNLPYWREFASWGLGWADLIDFFARHDCSRRGPYPAYRFRTEAGPLPARP